MTDPIIPATPATPVIPPPPAEGGGSLLPPVTEIAKPWYSEHIADSPDLEGVAKNFPTPKELLKSHRELQGLARNKGLLAPAADATPEQVQAWRKTIGVPAEAKDYVLPEVPELIKAQVDDALIEKYRKFAHEAGIPKEQFTKWMALHLADAEQSQIGQFQALEAAKADTQANLKLLWGDKTDLALQQVANFIGANDDENGSFYKALAESGALNNQVVLTTLHRMAQDYVSDSSLGVGDSQRVPTYEERVQLLSKKANSLPIGPERDAVRSEMIELMKQKVSA